jgi:hypothetical protein
MIILKPNSPEGPTTASGLMVSDSMAALDQNKPDPEPPDNAPPTAAAPILKLS